MSRPSNAAKLLPDPRGRYFRILLPLALFALSIGSWIILTLTNRNPDLEPNEARVLSLKEIYPSAVDAAVKWQPDAYLHRASLSFWPRNPSKASAGITFRSAGHPEEFLNVYIKGMELPQSLEITSERGEFPVPRPEGAPINPSALGLDSVDALKVILEHGGADFIARNQPASAQSLILEYQDAFNSKGPLVWRAAFLDLGGLAQLKILIDAHTGELLQVDNFQD